MKATDALIEDLKLWACSPRVPLKAQIVMIEAIGRLSAAPEALRSAPTAWQAVGYYEKSKDRAHWEPGREPPDGALLYRPAPPSAKPPTPEECRNRISDLHKEIQRLDWVASGSPSAVSPLAEKRDG